MKADVLKAAGVDVEEGVERFSGREDLYRRFVYEFASDENFSHCREAMKKDDIESAFTYAHALKGITGNLSMNQFYQHLCNVVEALRAKDGNLANKLFVDLSNEYDRLLDAIEASKE